MTRQRIPLIVLLAWALVMIVPDLLRVVQPLGSFGFYADNDGLIYNVTGQLTRSPIRLLGRPASATATSSLSAGCAAFPTTAPRAGNTHGARRTSARAAGREATFELKANGDHPERQVTLKAAPVPANPFERFIVSSTRSPSRRLGSFGLVQGPSAGASSSM